jgi:RNA polymerase sigma-70 factor (ECF subfamily)
MLADADREQDMDTGATRRPDASDRDLIDRAIAGDAGAFDALIERYGDRLDRFVRSRVADRDAEDVLQDVLVAIWRGIPALRWERPRSFAAWAFSVARNRVADHHRRASRWASHADAEPEPEAVEFESSTLAAQTATRWLAALPFRQRRVLELRVLAGLSTDEVAAATGISLPMVKTLQHRGLMRLRHALDDRAA